MVNRVKAALNVALWGVGLAAAAPAGAADLQTMTIRFAAKVGDQPFTCSSSYQLGSPALSMRPTDFRLYVSDLKLTNQQGTAVPISLTQDGKWQYQNVALLDFEDKSGACTNGTAETRTEVVGTVPAGDYRGLQFTLGLPFALNHTDSTLAASPLNLTSLWWNWRGGYKFVRIDLASMAQAAAPVTQILAQGIGAGPLAHGASQPTSQPTSQPVGQGTGHGAESGGAFAIHLGSTGCEAASTNQPPVACQNPNRVQLSFASFDPSQNTVVADLAALLANANLGVNQPDTPPGCMSSPEDGDCASILRNLGLPFGGQAASGQTFFRVE